MVSSQARLAVFGVALHALLIYAMFDVHFLTPLVHGMEPTTADFAAPASRLVVIVADGLRADRLFELEDAPETSSCRRFRDSRSSRSSSNRASIAMSVMLGSVAGTSEVMDPRGAKCGGGVTTRR